MLSLFLLCLCVFNPYSITVVRAYNHDLSTRGGQGEEGDSRDPKVYGGRIAQPNEYPYMAALYKRVRDTPVFGFTCGGSIYNKEYIVTASHCLYDKEEKKIDAKNLRIVVGQTKVRLLLREENSPELIPISKIFQHSDYDSNLIYFVKNDIAMLKLNRTLNYTSSIKKLRVASSNEGPIDGIGDVIGWGKTEAYYPHGRPIGGNTPDLPISLQLKTARLRIVPRQLCTLRHFAIVPDTILCVGSEGILDTQSACFGDSGGPLACKGPSGPYLCGMVSTGTGCGLRFTPAFYTDVSKYNTWLRKIGGNQ